MGFLFFNFWRKRGGDFRRGTFQTKLSDVGGRTNLNERSIYLTETLVRNFLSLFCVCVFLFLFLFCFCFFMFLCNHCNDFFCPLFDLSCISHVLCEPSKLQARKCSLSYLLLHWKFCYHSEVSCWTWNYFQLYYEVFFPVKSEKWVIQTFPLIH